MYQCPSSSQKRKKNRLVQKNKAFIEQMQILENNITSIKLMQQQVDMMRSSIDSFNWSINQTRDELQNVRNEIGTIISMRMIFEQMMQEIRNLIAQNNGSAGYIMSTASQLQYAITDLKETVENANKILNDPIITNGLEELIGLSNSIENID